MSPEEWREVAQLFETRWNFPHCIGAIDGKHVAIMCPPKGSSLYYNYKGFHSIVLMALVDADYKFIYGSGSDGEVLLLRSPEESSRRWDHWITST